MSREHFIISNYAGYEQALCTMGHTSDNSDVNNISSRQYRYLDVGVQSGSSGNEG